MDSKYPASLSENVHKILREELNFDGVIMTDDLYMDAIRNYTGDSESAVMAVKAGNDILCCTDFEIQYPAVLKAVQDGEIPVSQIDASVRRILEWKQKLGLI
jgi:beta-N-acetylhexosaminidase